MLERFEEIEVRFEEVKNQLMDTELMSDMKKYAVLNKEYKKLDEMVKAYHHYKQLEDELTQAKELIDMEDDEEMKAMAKEEINELEPKLEELMEELKMMLIPKDPADEKDVIMEIRAGTGGDEASIFAGDLFRMYQRYCESNKMKVEVESFQEGTSGGYKQITLNISGSDVYGILKYESGVHRVQRVPQTETQGRVHTSAAAVVVLPQAEEFDVEVKESDVKVETFCASGPGGQSVNTTYSAVRLTHIPSGVVVSMQDQKSQIKNREKAFKILYSRLYDIEVKKRQEEASKARKSLVSTGDRSEKIRTYNYPQNRVTDHRIGLTLYNLGDIVNGDLGEIIEKLRIAENTEKLKEGSMI